MNKNITEWVNTNYTNEDSEITENNKEKSEYDGGIETTKKQTNNENSFVGDTDFKHDVQNKETL